MGDELGELPLEGKAILFGEDGGRSKVGGGRGRWGESTKRVFKYGERVDDERERVDPL